MEHANKYTFGKIIVFNCYQGNDCYQLLLNTLYIIDV